MASNKRSLPKIKTQKEWKSKYDFLSFDTTTMKCLLCTKYMDKITPCKNYNPSFIDGSDNFRLSSVTSHQATDMHNDAIWEYADRK